MSKSMFANHGFPSGRYKSRSVLAVLAVITGLAFLGGCHRGPTTGGDSPVTTARLTGSRLTDIGQNLTWTFDDTMVVIDNGGQPLPPDVVQELLVSNTAPNRVEAAWKYDEKAGLLRLSDVTAGGQKVATERAIRIKPAGHVRVNLGSRQYNLFHDDQQFPEKQ